MTDHENELLYLLGLTIQALNEVENRYLNSVCCKSYAFVEFLEQQRERIRSEIAMRDNPES
jgi:hypothetical protein